MHFHNNLVTRMVGYQRFVPTMSRAMASVPPSPPPLGQENSTRGTAAGDRRGRAFLLITATAALGGLYYYNYSARGHQESRTSVTPEGVKDMRHSHEAQDRVSTAADTGKSQMTGALRLSQGKLDEAVSAAQNKREEIGRELKDRTRQGVQEAKSEMEGYTNMAKTAGKDAKRKIEEVEGRVSQKAEEGKSTLWRWFGLGGRKSEVTKQRTAETVAGVADDVQKKAENRN